MNPSFRIRCIRYTQRISQKPELCAQLGVDVLFNIRPASEKEKTDNCGKTPSSRHNLQMTGNGNI